MTQKLISWNVNGIRAIEKKGFVDKIKEINPDVLCLQETKAQDDQVAGVLDKCEHPFFSNSAERKGYSGTAIITRPKPIKVERDMGLAHHDMEGRILCAEYDKFFLVNVYVPNSGAELARLDYRQQWDADFTAYLKNLESNKPVVLCGDLNVAHQPIDLANPKSNYNKSAGYTQAEIDGLSNLLNNGFVDTFRMLHPDEVAYSWWSYRFNARAKNVGWRIDYFLVSQSIAENVKEAFILPEVIGSDHCPVGIVLDL